MSEPWHGRFCWYELMTTDPKAAEGFYAKVVGWGTQAVPGTAPPYTMWTKGDQPVGGLMEQPAEAKAGGAPPSWMIYVAVVDVEACAAQVQALGGKVELAPREIPGVGRFAVLSDPQGAVFAILQPADSSASRPETPPAPLDISWRELATTDPAAAMAFYAALFGWEKQNSSDLGPMGTYQEFGRPGMPLGGIYRKPAEGNAPSHWLLYARVADIHASVAEAKALGGTVHNGPMAISGGDLVAQAFDPQGAAFALHQAKA